jgi:hypothetical protein
VSTDVSEEHVNFIFKVEEQAEQVESQADFFIGLFFYPDDEGDMFHRNVC